MKQIRQALVLVLALAVIWTLMPSQVTDVLAQAPTRLRQLFINADLDVGGDFRVGNGTPSVTQNGEDAYIEGTFEVDGASNQAGAATFGSTLSTGGAATLGGNLILEKGETIANSQNDMITVTTAATGHLDISVGNFKVGNGNPGNALNGEDAYVEGTLEVDGLTYLDGGAYCTTFVLANGETIDNSQNDMITMTTAATGFVSISTGNFKVGDGNPGTAQDGEDAYVEGGLEVDGTAKLDGAVNVGGAETVTGVRTASTWDTTTMQATLSLTNGTEIVPTGSLQPIDVASGTADIGAGAITTTGIAVGSRLVLISQSPGATTIGITDTTGMTLTANMAMGTDDTLTLVRMGSGWVEISRADN